MPCPVRIRGMAKPTLRLILGDQLTHTLPVLTDGDPSRDIVLMAEVLGEALGGGTLVTAVCVALGLLVTTVKAQGLTLYRFVPILFAFALRRIRGRPIEPEEGPPALPQASLTIRDSEGKPIVYQES